MSKDVLSDMLRSVRLRGVAYYHVTAGDEWVAETHAARDIARHAMPGAEHVMEYHVVTRGSCWGGMVGHPALRLEAGDIIMFPHGDAHVISSAPGMRAAAPAAPATAAAPDGADGSPGQLPFTLRLNVVQGTDGRDDDANCTTLICGFFGCDVRPFNPLIAALPKVLHLRGKDDQRDGWIVHLMRHAVAESQSRRAGGEAMLERLSEMMFVDAMRRYADTLPDSSVGWFAGLRDRQVGRALACMHDAPGHAWTIDELGGRVGMSRSTLHRRFVDIIGQPPMQYLASWRMQVGVSLLLTTNAPVASIALQVGYDSEAAFSRAFRRQLGAPPATWRRLNGRDRHDAAPAA